MVENKEQQSNEELLAFLDKFPSKEFTFQGNRGGSPRESIGGNAGTNQ